jgi:hypothetical protein
MNNTVFNFRTFVSILDLRSFFFFLGGSSVGGSGFHISVAVQYSRRGSGARNRGHHEVVVMALTNPMPQLSAFVTGVLRLLVSRVVNLVSFLGALWSSMSRFSTEVTRVGVRCLSFHGRTFRLNSLTPLLDGPLSHHFF